MSPPRTRRVLHVIPSASFGGAPQVMLDVMRRSMEHEAIEVALCILDAPETTFEGFDLPVTPVYLHYRFDLRSIRKTARCVLQLRRLIKDFQPDLIHTHLLPADLVTAMAVTGMQMPQVSHVHGTLPWIGSPATRNKLRRWLYRCFLNRKQTRFAAVSQDALTYSRDNFRIPAERFALVLQGVEMETLKCIERPRSDPSQTLVFCTAGRFCHEKGHVNLLRAFAPLVHEGLNVRLDIAGDGGMRREYEQLIEELKISDQVRLPGTLTDMPAFYRQADVFVLPSLHSEGLPLVLLESMAAGMAVIATRSSGTGHLIDHAETGWMVPPDDITSLTAAMKCVAENPTQRETIAHRGREKALSGFSTEQVVHRVKTVYNELLDA